MKHPPEGKLEPFRTSARRAIAMACRDSPRTRAELGKQFGVPPGSLESALKSLLREEVLQQTTVNHARGAAFQLRAKWRRSLDRVAGDAHKAGRLSPGLRLLLVGAGDGLAEALAAAVVDPAVVWACRVDGRARLLIAVEAATPVQVARVDRVESIFAAKGLDCIQLAVGEVMPAHRFSEYVRTLAGLDPKLAAIAN